MTSTGILRSRSPIPALPGLCPGPCGHFLNMNQSRATGLITTGPTINSLQVTLTKRASHGLSFLISYTFSKALATSDRPALAYNYNAQDFYNRKGDYSVSAYNYPQD